MEPTPQNGTASTASIATGCLPLRRCYEILFTDAEKEHLTYDFFMEDWNAFCVGREERGDPVGKDGMTLDIAVEFLEVMQ